MRKKALSFKAALVSLLMFLLLVGVWQVATAPAGGTSAAAGMTAEQIEYQKMLGKDPTQGQVKSSGFPTPAEMAATAWKHLSNPFYDNGPNDKGIAIQLAWSLARVGLGFALACMVAVPLGFVIGMSPLLHKAFDPFIQVLKPISPLAWMPLALYTIKDSSVSGIFVIFICSVWPMLLNTAFGVASVKREWLNVASTLEVKPLRRAFRVILPAAAPTILTGMRISMSIAWLVIVAAEMLVGGTGIGYFVWNEWNNLSLTNVIFAILLIGVVGMLLDQAFAALQRKVTYVE
ncbi:MULTISPECIES: nitrate ABC transporter permease [Variovorax]|uniref:Nitrate/nitrite transport system permease protein n=1 Tax=Variovorax guangxiensis TaxID=1775474 RepID=A0A840FIS1_9BURK|nr:MULTISPECIES: nitrate ABC transporter permease [Variovorax]MBB3638406.1 nitrate/nitrite transport system permease protein [Variovorax sp. BK613]MBB4220025.1 nitrate/nitrite transport system permease protein [Variovorax guangxiensis]MDR6519746.1 nitrate/nitrite transport system permease protein [Variovorax paradoxus]